MNNNEQPPFLLKLSHSNQHAKSGDLSTTPIELTFRDFSAWLFKPVVVVDKLNAGFIQRYLAMRRGNEFAGDTAYIVIIDGDSRIDANGNEVSGASNPMEIHLLLNFLGIDHLMATSHSNDVGKWKFRVYFPATYTREQLAAIIDWFFERTAENGIALVNASENLRWSQIWFKPCCRPNRKHLHKVFWRIDGKASNPIDDFEFEPAEPFDVERIYSEWLAKQAHKSPVKKAVAVADRPKLPIATDDATNTTDPIAAFNKDFTVYQILARNGFKQVHDRYIDPNSESGAAGITIVGNGDSVYCHHNNSVLSGTGASTEGRYHDAFSLYLNLEHGGDMKAALNWNEAATKAAQVAWCKARTEATPRMDFSNLKVNGKPINTQNTQKPNQLKTDSAQCLVDLHTVKGSEPFNSQISIG